MHQILLLRLKVGRGEGKETHRMGFKEPSKASLLHMFFFTLIVVWKFNMEPEDERILVDIPNFQTILVSGSSRSISRVQHFVQGTALQSESDTLWPSSSHALSHGIDETGLNCHQLDDENPTCDPGLLGRVTYDAESHWCSTWETSSRWNYRPLVRSHRQLNNFMYLDVSTYAEGSIGIKLHWRINAI